MIQTGDELSRRIALYIHLSNIVYIYVECTYEMIFLLINMFKLNWTKNTLATLL